MLFRPGRLPKRLANEDNDGVVVVALELATVVVLLLVFVDVAEVFDTAAAAAAAASKNIFIDGKPDSMLLLKPKFANDAAAAALGKFVAELDFAELPVLNALA